MTTTTIPATPKDELEASLKRLARGKDTWIRTSVSERLKLLEALADAVQTHAQGWAEAMHQVRGVSKGTPFAGEDWFYGPMVTARNIRLLTDALKAGGQPKPPGLRQRANGQWVADIFPNTLVDKLSFQGWRVEQWLEPDKPPSQGKLYRQPPSSGKVCLVLGAGNIIGIPATDVLHKLFVEGEVCIVKLNPVNEAGGPFLEKIFAPFVEQGWVAFAYGGPDVGKLLTDHELVDSIHITGSDKTHDAIIWGATPEEQRANKEKNTPRLSKEISSELGCVTPVIVAPGDWTEQDLVTHAQSIAGMVTNNMSFMCVAAKVLVMHRGWPLRERFLDEVENALANVPARDAYYPGAHKRYEGFLQSYPQARVVGPKAERAVPWTLIRDVPAKKGEYALTNEAFCGVLAEVSIEASDAADFLAKATRFVNEDVWGNLSCVLIIDPATQKRERAAFENTIAELRYGSIAINAWSAANFTLMEVGFGAFPGNPLHDIQSGRGIVHNGYLFDHPQKGVLSVPFRWMARYPWSAGHKSFDALAMALTRFERSPSLLKLMPVAAAALRG